MKKLLMLAALAVIPALFNTGCATGEYNKVVSDLEMANQEKAALQGENERLQDQVGTLRKQNDDLKNSLAAIQAEKPKPVEKPATRVHWFIPDGMRADPKVFDIYGWAEEGKLPNLRRLMQRGAYGYSIPTFPSHTPTNFATLLTGAYPERHGIADVAQVERHELRGRAG